MITMCFGCALLAAWLGVPGAAARTVRMRLEPAAAALSIEVVAQAEGRRRRRRSWIYLAIVIILLALIIAAGYIARARGAVLTCAALNLTLTTIIFASSFSVRRSAGGDTCFFAWPNSCLGGARLL